MKLNAGSDRLRLVTPDAFERFSARLRDNLAARPEVLGLVLMGSTAAHHRADEWSDHDFAVVTVDGGTEALRGDLGWLPDSAAVALAVREDHDGHKVVYDDGHVLEFGVTTLDGLRHWYANSYEVVLDRGGVAETFRRVAARAKPKASARAHRELDLFVTLILIGTGRCRRGEVLVAGQLVRAYAVDHLITAWRLLRPAPSADLLDDLDSFRRFEQVYPGPGAAIATALERDVETAARRLLDVAEIEFGAEPAFPTRGAAAIRRRLDWSEP